jgi:hypothetical protein
VTADSLAGRIDFLEFAVECLASDAENFGRLPDYFKQEALEPHNVTFGVTDEELDTLYDF